MFVLGLGIQKSDIIFFFLYILLRTLDLKDTDNSLKTRN